ncbi:hypothetical protein GY21_15820 [Cryobacterium roopkundense]|uniref:Lipopolysaccharide/colanic/teichoic acid biosynthesis glycosyltransferase n=1 Tax=Cryobacterium roopkundense TaxID=1001240 RepID=A0A099J4H5_9MICO|nr:sugar transferase [Cryobacterium roopkundense]KGJ72363.1 hypothetical protein GY21_15820 [Cryobacterium roopkundense]MBB5642369.1 lipopolysaccharide/colanic/teichoic acid biosynthesis glycosyltransferase [Cryobacterium roopkundense]
MTGAPRGYLPVKRMLDVLASGLGLLVLSPVLLGVAVAVAVNLGRPVLFVQNRPGLHGRIFRLYKFRTMTPGEGPASDDDRLTPFGRALRSTSLDELPTLVNVLRGDMSLVGPRPLLVSYLPRYTPEQARRHEVRPGVTGLVQVSGRNALSWHEKFALDAEYVARCSFALDVRILARTVRAVLLREGISQAGHSTAPEFLAESTEGAL